MEAIAYADDAQPSFRTEKANANKDWSPVAYCSHDHQNLYLNIDANGLPYDLGVEYAAHLFKGGEMLSIIRYQEHPDITIPLNGQEFDKVTVFVRDMHGNIGSSDIIAPTECIHDLYEESLPCYW